MVHQQSGHGHSHGGGPGGNERRVLLALVLTAGFMIAEVVGGLLSGSLALLADAGHMLTDAVALALTWVAFRLARRPSDQRRSFGYHRFEVLAAFVNGLVLFGIAGWIVIEAARRLGDPVPVLAGPMLVIATLGLLVNIAAFLVLRGGSDNLNLRSAVLHVLGDLLGSVAAIGAALVILATGWFPIDPILSVLVALLVLRSAWAVVRQSTHILLEGTPEGIDGGAIAAAVRDGVAAVTEVHHVHAWSLTAERRMVTLHATVAADTDRDDTLGQIRTLLERQFGIGHATIQLERASCDDHCGR
ncbi:MAG: cation diffusion facilitator family transporter [Azospirillum sp.]|nr:cation diffusion facilitator family transporter [Azospirillum sp.]